MERRDLIKTAFLSVLAGGAVATGVGCRTDGDGVSADLNTDLDGKDALYGRTPEEIERDAKVRAEEFLTEGELNDLAVLVDLILPATATAGSATEAGVVDFIEFIVKDIPSHQLPIRGGMMWVNSEAQRRFANRFAQLAPAQQRDLLDDLAYPDPNNERPDLAPGIQFFDRLRNLTLTGYYTSKMGIEDLGYTGNFPNVWDGVPQSVLDKHGVAYEAAWLKKCVDQSQREVTAQWDEAGNLLT